MKKEPVNPDVIMNELKGRSSYFTEQPNTRTNEQPNTLESDILQQANDKPSEKATKRMSFEGFVEHEQTIREIQHLYYKRTGKQLSTSAIIREGLSQYLPKLLEALGGKVG